MLQSCAPACHGGCCSSKKLELSRSTPLIHSVPSGCTANCVYECLPGCPPACCTKTAAPEISRYTYQQPETEPQVTTPLMFSFPQQIVAPYVEQSQMYPQEQSQAMYTAEDQSATNSIQSPGADISSVKENSVSQGQEVSTNFVAAKHCPSSCMTHCSPECVRSDCCDLD